MQQHDGTRVGPAAVSEPLEPLNREQRRHPERIALSVDEVCTSIGVSREWVYSRIRRGQLRSTKVAGRRFIPTAEVERLVNGGDLVG